MSGYDGFYFTYALKPNGPNGQEGKNSVLWYKVFKFGKGNDDETPDENVQTKVIYPIAPGIPPETDFVVLEGLSHDNSKSGAGMFVENSLLTHNPPVRHHHVRRCQSIGNH
jgi:hypothetical protein